MSIILFFFTVLFPSEYDVGDVVSIEDQLVTFPICNGEYYNPELSLSDFNGDLNGGHYFVTWFDISATW
tara:strand:- start:2327 stop:2533 length:207 start_codon:yes stop_codon:yes gene_type:complete